MSGNNNIRQKLKKRCDENGWKFDLQTADITRLFLNTKCCYCSKPVFKYNDQEERHDRRTIERVDARIGYTRKNIALACFECNKLKAKFDHHQFFHLFFKIFKFSRKAKGIVSWLNQNQIH